MEQLYSVVVRNSLFSVTGKLVIKAISFLFTIFVIRWLGDEGYGQYTLIWSYVAVFAMLSDAGLSLYTIREIAKKGSNSQYLVANVVVIRIILVVITIPLIILTAQLAGYSDLLIWQLFLASTILFLYAVQDPLDALLQAHERLDLSTVGVALGQLTLIITGLIFLVLGGHITGLIIAGLLSVLVSIGLAWRFTANYRGSLQWRFKPTLWLGFIRESFSFGLIKLWLSWWLKIDIIILSWFWFDGMVGWYGAAYAIVLGVTVVSNAVSGALYPTLSRQYAQDLKSVPRIYELTLKYLLIVSLPLAGGLFLTASDTINILYGSEFAPTAVVLQILIWVVPLAFVSEFFRYALLATNQEKSAVQILGLVMVFSIGFNLWFIPRYGFLAAGIIAVIAEATLVALYGRPLQTTLRQISLVNAVGKPIIATFIMMLVVWGMSSFWLPVQIILGGLTYLMCIGLFKMIEAPEYKLFLSLLKRPKTTLRTGPRGEPMPLISIFIPAYNAEPFIEQAIDSVLRQSYQNYELIIINDGSTDNTSQILANYQKNPKIRIYHNEKNLGMAPTWNVGLDLCRGRFIAKLDADDFYEPEYLQTVVEFLQNNQEVGLVFTGLHLIYPDGRKEPEMAFLNSWVRDRDIFLPKLLELCMIRSPTVCVRRDCYQKLGNFVETMRIHADWEMWVRIAANYQVGFVAHILANYRTSYGENCTAQAANDGRSMQDLQLWLNMLKNNELPYHLSPEEENRFRWGIYQLEMHFAGMAAYHNQRAMQKMYTSFAENVLLDKLPTNEMERMRRVQVNLHQGILAFRDYKLKEARGYFWQAIKSDPLYCRHLWIWSKLLLTFIGRTKWGILYK